MEARSNVIGEEVDTRVWLQVYVPRVCQIDVGHELGLEEEACVHRYLDLGINYNC